MSGGGDGHGWHVAQFQEIGQPGNLEHLDDERTGVGEAHLLAGFFGVGQDDGYAAQTAAVHGADSRQVDGYFVKAAEQEQGATAESLGFLASDQLSMAGHDDALTAGTNFHNQVHHLSFPCILPLAERC